MRNEKRTKTMGPTNLNRDG